MHSKAAHIQQIGDAEQTEGGICTPCATHPLPASCGVIAQQHREWRDNTHRFGQQATHSRQQSGKKPAPFALVSIAEIQRRREQQTASLLMGCTQTGAP